jgi:4-carboxymuconolactone decarboxylase
MSAVPPDETAACTDRDATDVLARFELGTPTRRFARGVATQRQLDPTFTEEVLEALSAIAPDFARLTIEIPFGDFYSRPGLGLRDRQLVTITALASQGQERQLKVHLRFALNVGLTQEEIVEAMMQLAVYSGWPVALNALRAAAEVFAGGDARP